MRGCRLDDLANSLGLDSWSFRSLSQEKPHLCTYLIFLVNVVFSFLYFSVFPNKNKRNEKKNVLNMFVEIISIFVGVLGLARTLSSGRNDGGWCKRCGRFEKG